MKTNKNAIVKKLNKKIINPKKTEKNSRWQEGARGWRPPVATRWRGWGGCPPHGTPRRIRRPGGGWVAATPAARTTAVLQIQFI